MTLRMLDYPRLIRSVMPPTEREAASQVNDGLMLASAHIRRFKANLALFDESEARRTQAKEDFAELIKTKAAGPHEQYREQHLARASDAMQLLHEWKQIAARDGAIAIFEFGKTIELTLEETKKCPSLSSIVTMPALSDVLGPTLLDYWSVRNSSVHASENIFAAEKHAATGTHVIPGTLNDDHQHAQYFGGMISNRTIAASVRRKVCSFDLSQEMVDDLLVVQKRFFAPFQVAESVQKELLRPPGPATQGA